MGGGHLIITFKFQLLRDPLGKNPHEYYKYPNLRHKQKKGMYHLVMTNSSPWKITMLLSSVNHLFLWAIYTMANC